MDVNEIINLLNQILELGDKLDNTGVAGVQALTKGEHSTREATRLELGQFLLFIANGNRTLEEGEVALINLVLDGDYNADQLKQFAARTDEPNPYSCMTLMGFLSGDKAVNQENGTRSTQTTDYLIKVFEIFGNLMVAFDENSVSKAICAKYINGMKSYVMKNLEGGDKESITATYEFNDKIKFVLPPGFIFLRDFEYPDCEGKKDDCILAGEYDDDDGETCYKFRCGVTYTEYDPKETDEEFTSENLLDLLAERMGNFRSMKLPGTPKTILLNKGLSLSILGSIMKMYSTVMLVQVSDLAAIHFIITGKFNDDDPSENTERYENMYEVLKATRINGKKLPIDSISPSEIEKALQLTFDDEFEAIDGPSKLQFNITVGDETTTYEHTSEGTREVEKPQLKEQNRKESTKMDFYEIISMLNETLEFGDTLDNTGLAGVQALTKGEHSTREATRLELSHFLLYIANGNRILEDGEVALINLVLDGDYNADQLKQLAAKTNEPNPSSCMTLMGFLSGDKVLNQENGTRSTQTTDYLIEVFETFGNLMVAFDENSVSKAICAKYINGMKSYVMENL